MSSDYTLWHAPKLRSFGRAMARLDQQKPASFRDLLRLRALRAALLAGPLTPEALSVDPEIDEARGTLGLCLVGSRADAVLAAMLPLLRASGMAAYDPQEGVVYYADGTDSRWEKVATGVHEGVGICLAELQASPPLPLAVQHDALDALLQFVLADSPDEVAAVRLCFPVLLALVHARTPVAMQAALVLEDLCRELCSRGKILELDADLLAAVAATGNERLAEAVRAALSPQSAA